VAKKNTLLLPTARRRMGTFLAKQKSFQAAAVRLGTGARRVGALSLYRIELEFCTARTLPTWARALATPPDIASRVGHLPALLSTAFSIQLSLALKAEPTSHAGKKK
jgi:hypothetical protein